MLTPECCRAGRALLDWSLKDLAEKSGVAFTTISQFENGRPAHGTTQKRRPRPWAWATRIPTTTMRSRSTSST